jgi:cytochrome oxidase Cu insertion factor (SCO1/SenC/PrrC family)
MPMALSDNLPRRRTLVMAIVLLLAAVALAAASFLYRPGPAGPLASGAALVGGPFSAINHKGEAVTEKTYQGHYRLMFFGFTFCPDVCPTELQVMAQALKQLGPDGESIVPILVTIDPARDTPDVMKSYVEAFDPRLVGLTGSPAQIAASAKAWRVFYQKVENKDRPDDYTMDHSSLIFLMDRDNRFLKHFTYATDPTALADEIRRAISK